MQKNWIGKSEGLSLRWEIEDPSEAGGATDIEVYTTRPDTLYGASFLAIAADHPLAGEREVRLSTLSRHRQLVVASPLGGTPLGGQHPARLSPRVWQLNSYYAIAELVSQGIGWALVPEHIAAYPMYRSLVSRLMISELPEPASVGVELVRRRAAGQGPIARWLERELSARLSR